MRPRRSLADRLWGNVERRGPNECWPWIGKLTDDGYGRISRGGRKAERIGVHKATYELCVGSVPEGMSSDTYDILAKRFDVSKSAICAIKKRKTWKRIVEWKAPTLIELHGAERDAVLAWNKQQTGAHYA